MASYIFFKLNCSYLLISWLYITIFFLSNLLKLYAQIWLLINIWVIYKKIFLIRLNKVLNIVLVINLKNLILLLAFKDKIYLYFLYVTIRAKFHKERISMKKYYRNICKLKIVKLDFSILMYHYYGFLFILFYYHYSSLHICINYNLSL